MKRQKRNLPDRAFLKGYQVGVDGRSKSLCPHMQAHTRQSWLTGWREGREDLWDGFKPMAQAQKISSF